LKIGQFKYTQIIQNLKIFTKTIFSDLPSRLAVSYRILKSHNSRFVQQYQA
jgi:hypothetical protein